MTAVVPMDRAGRIVIPKDTRDAHRLGPGTKFLLVEGEDGSLWLQRLNPEELARRIHDELRGADLAPLFRKIGAEMEALASSKYPAAKRPQAGARVRPPTNAGPLERRRRGNQIVSEGDGIGRAGVIRRMTASEAIRHWMGPAHP